MPVDEAKELFKAIPSIASKLEMLSRVGMGYIKIGQSATTYQEEKLKELKLQKNYQKNLQVKHYTYLMNQLLDYILKMLIN